jgi:uncharacterized protein (DUF1697 family)
VNAPARRPVFVAMLRGVNVSGRNRLPMRELADALSDLGFTDVVTYVQSGNAVFGGRKKPSAVTATISHMLAERFGLTVPVVVRTAEQIRSVVAANPYLGREHDPTKLHVTFLADGPPSAAASIGPPSGAGRDTFEVIGREVYLHCPGGYGTTRLTNDFFERKLGTAATTRNWRTVLALTELGDERSAGR